MFPIRMTHQRSKNLPVDLDFECSTILPGQQVATEAAHQLPELPELSQPEVFYIFGCVTLYTLVYTIDGCALIPAPSSSIVPSICVSQTRLLKCEKGLPLVSVTELPPVFLVTEHGVPFPPSYFPLSP